MERHDRPTLPRSRRPRSGRLTAATALGLALTLGGCSLTVGASDPAPTGSGSRTAATVAAPAASATPTSGTRTVAGYDVGEIPPVPLFTLPDLSLLTSSSGSFAIDTTREIASVPGITVEPARCDEAGTLVSGSTVLYGDGAATSSDEDSSVTNYGDGSAVSTDGDVTVVNNGDGSGTYSSPTVSIVTYGDGSGTYSDGSLTVAVYGDGSGTWTSELTGESIVVDGDGGGSYTSETVSIINNGDGSATYSDSATGLSIINDGTGTALVDGVEVAAEPVAKVGTVGSFPDIEAVAPVTSCGTTITLEDGILFDFGSAGIRPEAAQTLSSLAQVLTDAGAPAAHVYGHTDSVGEDDFNQTLSEQRAQAVVDALVADGVTTSLDATGYGETRPVAANTNPDGSDNPGGRQLNRRVEIFVPAF